MKKLVITTGLLLWSPFLFAQVKQAEKSTPLFNTANNCLLRYYYYPNLEAYFDTQQHIYHFRENGEWKTADEIPNGYRGYSMYNKFNVMVTDYDDENICQFINIHKKKYPYITNERTKKLTASNDY